MVFIIPHERTYKSDAMEKSILIIPLLILCLVVLPLQSAFADTTIYSVVTPRTDVTQLRGYNPPASNGGSNIFVGEEFSSTSALLNQSFNKITILMEKETDGMTLTGVIYAGVWDSIATPTATNRLRVCGQMSANDVADAITAYTFSCTATWTLTANDAVGVFYKNTDVGNAGIFISTRGNVVDGVNTRTSCYTTAESPVSCADAGGAFPNQWVDGTTDTIMNLTLTDAFSQCITNPETLFCRLQSQGGAFSGPTQLLSTQFNTIAIQTGIIDGSNSDIKTNGVGYLLLIIAICIMIGIMWVASRGQLTEIPTFIWFIGVIALTAAFTFMNIVDATILIIAIIVVVAFATAKARNVFGGGGIFSGDSA